VIDGLFCKEAPVGDDLPNGAEVDLGPPGADPDIVGTFIFPADIFGLAKGIFPASLAVSSKKDFQNISSGVIKYPEDGTGD